MKKTENSGKKNKENDNKVLKQDYSEYFRRGGVSWTVMLTFFLSSPFSLDQGYNCITHALGLDFPVIHPVDIHESTTNVLQMVEMIKRQHYLGRQTITFTALILKLQ